MSCDLLRPTNWISYSSVLTNLIHRFCETDSSQINDVESVGLDLAFDFDSIFSNDDGYDDEID